MYYARIAIVEAITAAGAAAINGDGSLSCDTFTARLWIFEKATESDPASLNLRKLDEEEFTVLNPKLEAISVGDRVQVGQLVDERWVVLEGGGGGGTSDVIIFEILPTGESDQAVAESNDCEDQLEDAELSYLAEVKFRPCGVSRVPEEDEDGNVVVYDELEAFLSEREEAEVIGKRGIAHYLQNEDTGYCQWVITFIDWWRELQVIHDLMHLPDELRFKVKNVKVWDDCDLPDIVIPLTDCVEEYYNG